MAADLGNSRQGSAAPSLAPESSSTIPWDRYRDALWRRRGLVAVVLALGLLAGLALTRIVRPSYETRTTIWLGGTAASGDAKSGPVRGGPLLAAPAWAEVLRSYAVLDDVAERLSLFVTPERAGDSLAFAGFHSTARLLPGEYSLKIDDTGRRFTLEDDDGRVVDRGAVGSPVGARVGFAWTPGAQALGRDRTIDFKVLRPRQAAMKLRKRLEVALPDTSFLVATLTGPTPERDATILNEIGRRFSAVAADLTRQGQAQVTQTLETQLGQARQALRDAEQRLERFGSSVGVVPAPADAGVRDPVVTAFYDDRAQYDEVRQDRQALQRALAGGSGHVDVAGLLAIPSVREAPELTGALDELTKSEALLEAMRRTYTDQYQPLRELRVAVDRMKRQTLPTLAAGVLDRLRRREEALGARLGRQSSELRAIPARQVEQARLQREVQLDAGLYTMLKSQYDAARLAEASAVPGVAVLDTAAAPLEPVTNTRPGILLAALLASLALAGGIALFLDRLDGRLWHPQQAAELGLPVLGTVPLVRDGARDVDDPLAAAQLVEAFRGLRLDLRHELGGEGKGALRVAVLSAVPGEGKSLVAARLARACAEAGMRTVLVDGDVRRGALDSTFRLERSPGLVEHLAGEAPLERVIRATAERRLFVVPSGARVQRGPEFVGSPAMARLVGQLAGTYDAVIVDTPPLAAGADAYALATAVGNAVVVLRSGETDRALLRERLEPLTRLPVRLAGAVVNAVRPGKAYGGYAYLPEYALFAAAPAGYASAGDTEVPLLPAPSADASSGDGDASAGAPGAKSSDSARRRSPNHW